MDGFIPLSVEDKKYLAEVEQDEEFVRNMNEIVTEESAGEWREVEGYLIFVPFLSV